MTEEPKAKTYVCPTYFSTYRKKTRELGFEIDLPGVKKEDIHVKVLPEAFRLEAERDNGIVYFIEKSFPQRIDTETARAAYEEGMLLITAKIEDPLKKAVVVKL